MKKRKTYEISVIDRTYSKTLSDETKFYTSDTSLELVFKLKETEYTFESAEIVLLNINDKSLITRRVVKGDEGFVYTFEKDIIAHYGEWKAQLMFIENVDAHVASPIKFRIENDLYNNKPQALSDVVSWVNLKLYAEKLVGEFKQAVDEAVANVEAMDDTFKANELDRDAAEKERQSRFETNENERDRTFNANEDIRKSQELEREKAEATRQTTFTNNEAIRIETFNTNEATRQVNETTRQQAESQRQSTFETNETERQTTFETNETERQSVFNDNEATRQENEIVRQQALGDMNGLYERIYPVSRNLFNYNQLIYGGRLNRNTGGIIESDNSFYTEYIPVKENTPYTISKQGEPYSAVSYDSNYNRLEGYILGGTWGDTTIDTPMRASFLRYSFSSNVDYEKIMLNEGNEILPFEEYQDQGSHDKTVAGAFNYLLDNSQNNGGGGTGGGGEQVTRVFTAGEIIDVEKYSSAILDLQFGAADYHLEGSRNGTDYEGLQVIKTDSGTPYQRISVRGEYAVNLTGYTHIRLVLDFLALNPQNFRITLSTETFKNNIDTRPKTFYAPKKPKFEYTLNETGNVTYLSGDKNGIVYGVTTDEVFKSSDYGLNWVSLGKPATGAYIQYVQKLDNGNILAISKYGTVGNTEYFIMDATTGTWQSKYSHPVQGSYNPGFGFDVYDNVILFAPYQNPKLTEVIQVHYSNDYGETWKPIFDSPADILEWHIHDVAYDPYKNRIYIANGDNIDGLNADVIWSADEGKTWHHVFDGKPRSQFTAILPTPTQIIFGTDESRVRGAFRHPRGFDNPFVIDPAFHDMEPGGTNKHIVVGRGSHYWDTGNVAYLYARNPAEIYATKDGYNYFSMLKIGSDDTAGSLRNLSPLYNGKMTTGYFDADGKGYVMVIENVEWEQI